MAKDYITSLPLELKADILSGLDAVSLARCAMTSKSIFEALRSSSKLELIIELHLSGLKCDEDEASKSTCADLVHRLRSRRKAWSALEWHGPATLEMDYCDIPQHSGGALVSAYGQDLQAAWLPTSTDEARIDAFETRFHTKVVATDPTQDALALLHGYYDSSPASESNASNAYIELWRLSTTEVHPQANGRRIKFYVRPCATRRRTAFFGANLQFAQDRLVLFFERNFGGCPQLMIWDWKTSDLVVSHTFASGPLSFSPECSLGLVTPEFCFVTSQAGNGSLLLYSLKSNSEPLHLATLHLPPKKTGIEIVVMEIQTSLIEGRPRPHTPFMLNDDDRLYVLTMNYSQGIRRSRFLNLFVHQRVFMRYCKQQLLRGGPPLDIAWEEWGPYNTRLIYPALIGCCYLKSVHGQRVACKIDARDRSLATNAARILDFSLGTVKSASASGLATLLERKAGEPRGTLLKASLIRASELPFFEEDVETSLPCVSTVRHFNADHDIYMMDADSIVGVQEEKDEYRRNDNLVLNVYSVL